MAKFEKEVGRQYKRRGLHEGGERVWNSQPTKPLKVFIFINLFAQTQMHCRVNTVICLFHDFTEQQKKQHFEFSNEILSVYIPTLKLRPGLHLI